MNPELFGGFGPATTLPQLDPDTQSVGFDEVTVHFLQTPVTVGGIVLMGKCLIFTVPQRVERAELRGLAVQGSIEGAILDGCWWQLQIEEGATQEILTRSEEFGAATVPTALVPPRTSGFQYGRYGSLHEPQELYVQLRSGQRLLIVVYSNPLLAIVNLTVYVRARGVVFTGV